MHAGKLQHNDITARQRQLLSGLSRMRSRPSDSVVADAGEAKASCKLGCLLHTETYLACNKSCVQRLVKMLCCHVCEGQSSILGLTTNQAHKCIEKNVNGEPYAKFITDNCVCLALQICGCV